MVESPTIFAGIVFPSRELVVNFAGIPLFPVSTAIPNPHLFPFRHIPSPVPEKRFSV